MHNFFKKLGQGILNIFVLPGMLILLIFTGIWAIGLFIFLFFKSIYLFFTGRSLYKDLPEDKLAKQILANAQKPAPEYEAPVQSEPQAPQTPLNTGEFTRPQFKQTNFNYDEEDPYGVNNVRDLSDDSKIEYYEPKNSNNQEESFDINDDNLGGNAQ